MFTERLTTLRTLLKQSGVSTALISSPTIVSYLTGYTGFSASEREAYLLITKRSLYLFTDARYAEATTNSILHAKTFVLSHENPLIKCLLHLAKPSDGKIGFEPDDLTVSEFIKLKRTKLSFSPLSLRSLRSIKTREEIRSIQQAATIAEESFTKTKQRIKLGMTEKDVVKLFEKELREIGSDISFPTIVAFGKNASVPHHLPGDTKLKKNDLVLMDFGAKYDSYCSDSTRTFFVGKPATHQQEIYEIVEQAQKKAITFLESKIKNHESIHASMVDRTARDYIISQGYPTIPHSLGHGIGLEVHEAPTLSSFSKDTLTEGMVFSIEPGIYLPGEFGIRIEDLFVIKGSRLLKLTP